MLFAFVVRFKAHPIALAWVGSSLYRNLNAKNDSEIFSVKQGSLVVAHTDNLILKDVIFKVSKSDQLRARRNGMRNVHAFAHGYICNDMNNIRNIIDTYIISYNPFKNNTFMGRDYRDIEIPIIYSSLVSFSKSGILASKV